MSSADSYSESKGAELLLENCIGYDLNKNEYYTIYIKRRILIKLNSYVCVDYML